MQREHDVNIIMRLAVSELRSFVSFAKSEHDRACDSRQTGVKLKWMCVMVSSLRNSTVCLNFWHCEHDSFNFGQKFTTPFVREAVHASGLPQKQREKHRRRACPLRDACQGQGRFGPDQWGQIGESNLGDFRFCSSLSIVFFVVLFEFILFQIG